MIQRLRNALHQIKRRCLGGGVVLGYHRVGHLDYDPQLLAISESHFEEHLRILQRIAVPLPLQELVLRAEKGTLQRRAIALTFDDGYFDNFQNAFPLLARFNVPATFFVATGRVNDGTEHYWDELNRLILQSTGGKVEVSIGADIFSWNCQESDKFHQDNWNVLQPIKNHRHFAYRALCERMRSLSHISRERLIAQIRKSMDMKEPVRSAHRTLDVKEIRQLSMSGLVEIGSHTVRHPSLSSLSRENQQREIVDSKVFLENVIGKAITSFAYPYGARSDYSGTTISLLRDAGYTIACANIPGVVWRGSKRYEIPRYLVRDWNGEELQRNLRQWFGG